MDFEGKYGVDILSKGALTHTTLACTATEAQYTLTAGTNIIIVTNIGSKIVYLGGTGVADDDYAIAIYPKGAYDFGKVKKSFDFYAVCGTGDTSTLGIAEYG